MTEKAEIEIGAGATITGNVVRDKTTATVDDSEAVAVGSNNTQDIRRTENDQRRYDQRTEQREYDQREDNRQYDQRADRRQYEQRDDSRGGNVTFQNQDNAVLWQELRAVSKEIALVTEKIFDVRFLLDDIPNRVKSLEIQVKPVPVPLPLPVAYFPPWVILGIVAIGALAGAFLIDRFF